MSTKRKCQFSEEELADFKNKVSKMDREDIKEMRMILDYRVEILDTERRLLYAAGDRVTWFGKKGERLYGTVKNKPIVNCVIHVEPTGKKWTVHPDFLTHAPLERESRTKSSETTSQQQPKV